MPFDVGQVARWLGLSAIAITFLLLLYILLLRGWLWLMERRRRQLWQRWRPLCISAACGLMPDKKMLFLQTGNWLLFFQLWHHYLMNVQGEARDNLRYLGRRIGLHQIVIKILMRASTGRRLIAATIAAGWLRDVRAWEPLVEFLDNEDPVLSFAAARSLTRIDPRAALRDVIPQIVKRNDWSKHLIAGLLLEAGPELVSAPLLDCIVNTPNDRIISLVRFLKFADVGTGNIVLFRHMPETQDLELLGACLQAARSPKVLPLVRECLRHGSWMVRVEAANALKRLGSRHDIDSLLPLLADPQWWVRYRVAQAIYELLHHDKDKLTELCRAQTDRFAADILMQVVAESI